ncbi:hypothetical protein KAR91_88265 [Candidatus Pacearchaeota archaeon]|nr:hypothetical protein [Candidatus Pacearchaeota archaeon]
MDFRKWENTRAKGKSHFILYAGVLAFGILATIFSSIIASFIYVVILGEQFSFISLFFRMFTFLGVFLIAGYFWGYMLWDMCERKYLAQTTKQGAIT